MEKTTPDITGLYGGESGTGKVFVVTDTKTGNELARAPMEFHLKEERPSEITVQYPMGGRAEKVPTVEEFMDWANDKVACIGIGRHGERPREVTLFNLGEVLPEDWHIPGDPRDPGRADIRGLKERGYCKYYPMTEKHTTEEVEGFIYIPERLIELVQKPPSERKYCHDEEKQGFKKKP